MKPACLPASPPEAKHTAAAGSKATGGAGEACRRGLWDGAALSPAAYYA